MAVSFSRAGPRRHARFGSFDNPFSLTGHDRRAPPKRFPEGPARHVRFFRRDPLVGSAFRRDLLVRSAVQCLIIHSRSPGTEVPRQKRG